MPASNPSTYQKISVEANPSITKLRGKSSSINSKSMRFYFENSKEFSSKLDAGDMM